MVNEFKVSESFVRIFQNFNVFDVRSEMKDLPREELFLLLDICIDLHDTNDSFVIINLSPFILELKEILLIQNGGKTENTDLNNLIQKTSPFLKTNIITSAGSLPDPYSKEEVRNLKLNKIFEK